MKTLKTIQTLAEIGKVCSKWISICCIIGLCVCGVGALAVLVGADTLKLGGITLHSILETKADVSVGTVLAFLIVAASLCVGEYFVAREAYRYFENELNAGTPFTMEGAKELLHLGVSAIWIPIVSGVLAQVAQGVIAQCMQDVEKCSMDGIDSVALGAMLVFTSLLCKHGAQCKENSDSDLPESDLQ